MNKKDLNSTLTVTLSESRTRPKFLPKFNESNIFAQMRRTVQKRLEKLL